MRGRLVLTEPDDFNFDGFDRDITKLDYKIDLHTDLNEKFEDLIKRADFKDEFRRTLQVCDEDDKEFYKECKKNQIELLNNCEFITFMFPIDRVYKYIEENPIIKDKKLLFQMGFELNLDIVSNIEKMFKDTSNIYFHMVSDSEFISFDQYKQIVKTIYNIVDEVNGFDFSPLEKIMYVYDIVRNKVYKEVDEGEDKMIARNLSTSLLGDKIVCVGYSKIFKAILNQLNIDCEEVLLHYSGQKGHARNSVFIKDKKYNIDGIYYFDVTYDAKKEENNNKYLFSYKFFAKTKDEIDDLTKKDLKEDGFSKYPASLSEDLYDELETKEIYEISDELVNSINYMSMRVLNKRIISKRLFRIAPDSFKITKNQLINIVDDLMKKFDTSIKAETFIEVLFNVRKEEYRKDPDKYPFDMNAFFRAILISEWNFNDPLDSTFLNEMYKKRGEKIYLMNKNNFLFKYNHETNLEERIEEAKKLKIFEKKK